MEACMCGQPAKRTVRRNKHLCEMHYQEYLTTLCKGKTWDRRVGFNQCEKTGKYPHEEKMYCKQHHPPTIEAKRVTDQERLASTCNEQVYGFLCGRPAVETSASGFGRCERHTDKIMAIKRRLGTKGPALLEAAKKAAATTDLVDGQELLRQAIEEAERD